MASSSAEWCHLGVSESCLYLTQNLTLSRLLDCSTHWKLDNTMGTSNDAYPRKSSNHRRIRAFVEKCRSTFNPVKAGSQAPRIRAKYTISQGPEHEDIANLHQGYCVNFVAILSSHVGDATICVFHVIIVMLKCDSPYTEEKILQSLN